jgi:hypothetical protein
MERKIKTKTVLLVICIISVSLNNVSAIDEWQKTPYAPHAMVGFKPMDQDPWANVMMNYTVKNTINGFIGWTFQENDLDENEVGRFLNMGLQWIVDDRVDEYSHEIGHVWKLDSLGARDTKMHYNLWDRSYVTYRGGLKSLDEMIEGWVAGHNIDTEIGRHAIERIYLSEISTNSDRLSFFNSGLRQLLYILNNNGKKDDYRSYVGLFNQREGHHEISLGRIQTFSTAIFLANLNNYESWSDCWEYVDTGRKYYESPYEQVTRNLELGKPDIAQHFLKDGILCTVSEYGLYKGHPFRLSVSHDVDRIVGGHLNTMIIGAELFDFLRYEDISSSFRVDAVLDENYVPTGFTLGSNGNYKIGPLSSVFWKIGYSVDHPVETYFGRNHGYALFGWERTW